LEQNAGQVELKRGLRGVYLDQTQSSNVLGEVGRLIYRGYDIQDLAKNSTFEETSFLLLHGHLPTQRELDEFDAQLKAARTLPEAIVNVIGIVKDAHPMDVLRTAVSALAAFDEDVNDNSMEATLRRGIYLTAQLPTIVACHARMVDGLIPVQPNGRLGHAANFLYMLFDREPVSEDARLMDVDFLLHADHSSNASAFAARVCASTLADLYAAITTGIATLKGPLHGGAAEEVTKMTDDIGDESNAEQYVKNILDKGGRVMGFGHAVYKAYDPRATLLRDGTRALGERMGQPKWFRILSLVEKVMQPLAARGISTNVDFWSGAIYKLLGIPKSLYVPIFAVGRMPGWVAQIMEQYANNMLIRPLLQYVGPDGLEYIPIEDRR